MRAGKPRVKRREIARGDDDDAAGIEMPDRQFKRRARIRQVLDHVEQNDRVGRAEPRQIGLIRHPAHDIQSGLPGMRRRVLGQLDAGDIEIALGFLEEKSVRAAELDQPPAGAVMADHVDHVSEFTPQHPLAAQIVAVTVGMLPGKIVPGVVASRIELRGFAAPKAAFLALEDVAAVLGIEVALRRQTAAGGAMKRVCLLQHAFIAQARKAVSMSSMYSSALEMT